MNGRASSTTDLISASLIVSGIATLIQVYSIPIWPNKGIRLGAGILSVLGTTLVFINIASPLIAEQMKVCMVGVPSTTLNYVQAGATFEQAYGGFLGCVMVLSPVPMLVSFIPPKILGKIFPRFLVGAVILLLGVSLLGTGFQSWGGGKACSTSTTAPCPTGEVMLYVCHVNACWYTTQHHRPFGSPQYVGLGFATFATIVLVELFGSPIMRSMSIVIGLMVGYLIACLTRYNGAAYVTTAPIDAAPWITFLWTTTFPYSIWPAGLLPVLVGLFINISETIGDVTGKTGERFFVAGQKHQGGELVLGVSFK